jgi:hypothetical protein
LAEAAVVTAHVTALPAEIAAAPPPRPATSRGTWRSVHVPSPTCPLAFAPQHLALPATVTAQACVTPTVMAVALADAGGSREAAAPEQTTTASAPRTRTGDQKRVCCPITLPSATPKLHFLHWGMPSRQEPGCNERGLSRQIEVWPCNRLGARKPGSASSSPTSAPSRPTRAAAEASTPTRSRPR